VNLQLGRLNLLTPERTAAASKLIQTGQVVNLKWVIFAIFGLSALINRCSLPVNVPSPPLFGRETFEHKIKALGPGGFDDLYNCNTQSGSQVIPYAQLDRKSIDLTVLVGWL
jgi:hypothetical protein